MKFIHQILAIFNGSKEAKQARKEDVKIQYNSTAFFLFGIIIASLGVWVIAESKFTSHYEVADRDKKLPLEDDYFFFVNLTEEQKPEKNEKHEVKKKVERKVIEKVNPIHNDSKIEDTPVDIEDGNITTPDTNPDTDTAVNNEPNTDNNNPVFLNVVEVVPAFPSCNYLSDNADRIRCLSDEINKIVTKRFNISLVERLSLQGKITIYVNFVVDKNGNITDVKARAPYPQLEKEAKRVVGFIPQLIPGMQNNKPVNVVYNLPITLDAQ